MNTASRVTIGERREALPNWLKLAGPVLPLCNGPESGHSRLGLMSTASRSDYLSR
jgi:hypothetical protein